MQIPFGKVTGPESISNSHRTKPNSRARTLSQNHSSWENNRHQKTMLTKCIYTTMQSVLTGMAQTLAGKRL